MRCKACDKIMTNYELTKKFGGSGEFVDMCNECSRFLADDNLVTLGNLDYADLYDLEEMKYVEDEQLDYGTGTEYGDEGEWS
tara:strand:+ start:1188 stop:1433 length:246 start_codon:yes stop_codon:yes gene_type:complete